MERPMYAWFSWKQAQLAGTVIWMREDGTEVEASQIDARADYKPNWPDAVSLGEVTDFVQRERWGWLPRAEMWTSGAGWSIVRKRGG